VHKKRVEGCVSLIFFISLVKIRNFWSCNGKSANWELVAVNVRQLFVSERRSAVHFIVYAYNFPT
jgi:hypothetical protein